MARTASAAELEVDVEITPDHLLISHHLQQYVANYVALAKTPSLLRYLTRL